MFALFTDQLGNTIALNPAHVVMLKPADCPPEWRPKVVGMPVPECCQIVMLNGAMTLPMPVDQVIKAFGG